MPRPFILGTLLSCCLLLFSAWPSAGQDPASPRLFSQEWLSREAERLSRRPYAPTPNNIPAWVKKIDYDAYQFISFKPDHALWRNLQLPFRAQFFHLGLYFHDPVMIHEVVQGKSHPITFTQEMFSYGKEVAPPAQTGNLGFAGFRGYAGPDAEGDFFAFLGASYFRAVGASKQYGLSARGLAVNTGMDVPEEFPRFTSFWLERPQKDHGAMLIHALLDSPSIAGAYTFAVAMQGDSTIMEVEAHLFPRRAIERIGIAPLTSMYHHGENDRRMSDDFRPEIHDSDGLAIWTGSGEWIWRPLVNPPFIHINSFMDQAPRGFGLFQRDLDFNNYQDDGAFYDRRPSLWVEPLGDWGEGVVKLVEIPASDETFDNIVAFWKPADPVVPGSRRTFKYRLHWGAQPPVDSGGGRVIATRTGAGGVPGQKKADQSRKFVIDFKGGKLGELTSKDKVEPVVSASRGKIIGLTARPCPPFGGWRTHFDLVADGAAPVDLRLYLRGEQGALTETWLYHWISGMSGLQSARSTGDPARGAYKSTKASAPLVRNRARPDRSWLKGIGMRP
ncbi:MAG: glucans biosynthesis protein [Desulfobacteraceae bacterium]|nr:MAG: glucans biosynthesis protein [Desulfobacteraceae bacterium]